jgi:hypothetical protein
MGLERGGQRATRGATMNTEQEKQLRQRIARLADNELVRTLFLFEHVDAIDVHVRDMMATVFPEQSLPENEVDIVGLLRGELRARILRKSRGAG